MHLRTMAFSAIAAALTASLVLSAEPASAQPVKAPPGLTTRQSAQSAEARSRLVTVPTLEKRATLSADYIAPGPPSGALATPANGRTGPFPGQVIPGFSGMIDNGDGTFWAMPDNGFGTKANSADFRLRL